MVGASREPVGNSTDSSWASNDSGGLPRVPAQPRFIPEGPTIVPPKKISVLKTDLDNLEARIIDLEGNLPVNASLEVRLKALEKAVFGAAFHRELFHDGSLARATAYLSQHVQEWWLVRRVVYDNHARFQRTTSLGRPGDDTSLCYRYPRGRLGRRSIGYE